MVNLQIDGKAVQIEKGATLLTAAEKVGIKIPTLCFLKKVSPTGACRICVVDIEGVDKPMAACHTVAIEGMVVTTQTPKLNQIRKQIVELLLVNHPLDCPVCDAAGECELQNICYDFDVDKQPFEAEDVNPETIDRWPLIQQVPSRCVMCEKCVKVCHETVGSSALFVNDKGDMAFIDKHLELCEFCGNCVQVCPTGTMISKTFKFKARPWELTRTESVCTTCSCHCEIDIHTKKNQIYRVTSKDEKTVNDGNLCGGGFFGHDYVNVPARLTAPLTGRGSDQQEISWSEALEQLTAKAKDFGGAACAGLTGGRLTNEENYLFQKLFRAGFGSNNIDSEASFGYLRAVSTLKQSLGLTGASNHLDRIGRSQAVLVFGADPTVEAPAVDWQIERSLRRVDGKLVVANLRKVKLSRHAHTPLQYRPGSEVALANALTRLVFEQGLADSAYLNRYLANNDELGGLLQQVDLDQAVSMTGLSLDLLKEAAQHLGEADSVAIVFGADVTQGANAEAATRALANLAVVCGVLHGDIGGLFPLDEKGNIQGTVDMGVAPSLLPGLVDYAAGQAAAAKLWGSELPASGLGVEEILAGIEAGAIKLLYLAGTNPLISYPESGRWRLALEKVAYLVVQDIQSSELTAMADLVLPAATFAEKSGSVTGVDGRVSYLAPALKPVGGSRPDLAIFSDLLAQCGGTATDLVALQDEIKQLAGIYEDICFTASGRKVCYKQTWAPAEKQLSIDIPAVAEVASGLTLLSGKILYRFGTTTNSSAGLAQVAAAGYVEMNPADAESHSLKDGSMISLASELGQTSGPLLVTDAVPPGVVFAPYHFADVNIRKLIPSRQNSVVVKVGKA
ncbi:MAG TPA: molybdopterin-dependent oxidoreductase [Geothermobacteraceae bacterium]|nr:molybdopterin-dependent oxidoreductase [Geothermobacteraceae bacterium]